MKLAIAVLLFLPLSCSPPAERPHRIGYINPASALGPDDFQACNEHDIYDYYNVNGGEDRTLTYTGGMKSIKDFIYSNYDPLVFHDQSGYLSLHFVVNCKSEAGRFEFVESSLDFEPKTFDPDLKEKMLHLTMGLKDWNALYLGGENRDAYMYLTFKLKDGEIIEILP